MDFKAQVNKKKTEISNIDIVVSEAKEIVFLFDENQYLMS